MAYTMVAERDNQTVKKERSSALILLANARVWASEGWQVSITDADGKEFDPALIENWLSPETSSPLQPLGSSQLQDEPRQDEAEQEDLRHDTALAAEAPRRAEASHENDGFYGDDESYDDESYEEDEAYADIDPENVRDDQDFGDQDFSEADGNLMRATNP